MDETQKIAELFDDYLLYRAQRIPLITSENATSPLVRAAYCLGISDQYCSRLPKNRRVRDNLSFGNVDLLDKINGLARNEIMHLFNVPDCEIRLLSGLSGLTVSLASFLKRGQTLLKIGEIYGGHLSVKPICDLFGVKTVEMMADENLRISAEHAYKQYRKYKPNFIYLDTSYLLFPHPVKEIREFAPDTPIFYDASQVFGLIAGGKFQKPLEEGADVLHGTTHKSFFGPQKSTLLFKECGELAEKVHKNTAFLVSNTHMHHILAVYISALEMKKFGKEYAEKTIKYAKLLGKELEKGGLDVMGRHCGFTESHQLWVNFNTKEDTINIFNKLEKLNFSTNIIFLPKGLWGLRLSTAEITRKGAKDETIKEIASILVDSAKGKNSFGELRKRSLNVAASLQEFKYTFKKTRAYERAIAACIKNLQK